MIFVSEMTLVALIICTMPSAGASFMGWLLARFHVTLEYPGLDACSVPAWLNWAFLLVVGGINIGDRPDIEQG